MNHFLDVLHQIISNKKHLWSHQGVHDGWPLHSSEQEATTTGGAETIDEIRSRIFGNHLGDGIRSGRKVLARPLLGPAITSYYPKDWFAGDPLLVDLAAER